MRSAGAVAVAMLAATCWIAPSPIAIAADERAATTAPDAAVRSLELRRYFSQWLASCRDDGSGFCNIAAFVCDPRSAANRHAFELRIVRPQPGADPEIVLIPVFDYVAPGASITVRIDQDQPVVLRHEVGYRPVSTLNDYTVVDRAVVDRLLARMRAGRAIRFSYRSADGRAVDARFGLDGFTAALGHVERLQSRLRRDPAPGVGLAAAPTLPTALLCSGNEPVWRLDIDAGEARYSTPLGESGRTEVRLRGSYRWLDYLKVKLFVWRGRIPTPGSTDLVAFITEERCADTMVDRSEPFTARLSLPDAAVRLGCCRPATAEGGEEPRPRP
ncbi:MAG: hypothetical protein FJX67_13100 [Alphaproteobacteria bacterium]|nr:hypothetical protein [Alphaproteobacteria bacterium]